jgi:predicted GNAT family N-acyltransferase
MDVTVKAVATEGELFQALAVREVVFIEEQHVPESLERDADDARAFHVLALSRGHAVGTGRLVPLAAPPPEETGVWAKVGRMAVLQSHRRAGVGSQLLQALEAEGRRRALHGILLDAQLTAMEFYRVHGYQPGGAAFEEAGIAHVEMRTRL